MRKFINRKCKCHGPTATCPTKTCWDELASFGKTGEYLKKLYNKADHVTIRQDGSIMKANPDKENDKSSKDKLVYLETSPNYCVENPDTGKNFEFNRQRINMVNCNYIFILQVVSARRQQNDSLIFESRCHLPACLPHSVEASQCPLYCRTSNREAVNTNFIIFDFARPRIELESTVSVL